MISAYSLTASKRSNPIGRRCNHRSELSEGALRSELSEGALRRPDCKRLSGGQVESDFQTGIHFKIWQRLKKQASWHAVVIVYEYL